MNDALSRTRTPHLEDVAVLNKLLDLFAQRIEQNQNALHGIDQRQVRADARALFDGAPFSVNFSCDEQ